MPTIAHLFHWHPPLRTGLQVPRKIHRESSPSYGAIPYYTREPLPAPRGLPERAGRRLSSKTPARVIYRGVGWEMEEGVTAGGDNEDREGMMRLIGP